MNYSTAQTHSPRGIHKLICDAAKSQFATAIRLSCVALIYVDRITPGGLLFLRCARGHWSLAGDRRSFERHAVTGAVRAVTQFASRAVKYGPIVSY
jgi:hypothetical protein